MGQPRLPSLAAAGSRDGGGPRGHDGACSLKGYWCHKSRYPLNVPCVVDDAQPDQPDGVFRDLLDGVCGPDFSSGPVCCDREQVEALALDFKQSHIFSCPACLLNYRQFWCSFTCSPSQTQFVDVVETQDLDELHDSLPKRVNYYVSDAFRNGFYNSCKSVISSVTNGPAMDEIGHGAETPDEFFTALGHYRSRVFQIDFPHLSPSLRQQANDSAWNTREKPVPMDDFVRSCASGTLDSRCSCTDCPDVCPTLPEVHPPNHHEMCKLFGWECFELSLLLLYFSLVFAFVIGSQWKRIRSAWGNRPRRAERDDRMSSSDSGFEHVRLAGDNSSQVPSEDPSSIEDSGSLGLMRFSGEGNLNALRATQPRAYALNRWLSSRMYSLGLACAMNPWGTLAIAALVLGIANLGWMGAKMETDPVKLWVSPDSMVKRQKDFFDKEFGPFHKIEQIFVTDKQAEGFHRLPDSMDHDNAVEDIPPVLDWDRLVWWADVDAEIRALQAGPNLTTFQDVCYSPSGPGGACVVQSVMGYFDYNLTGEGVDEQTWRYELNMCLNHFLDCMPPFGQPISPNMVLGGIPSEAPLIEARALVGTWLVQNTLNATLLKRAELWEKQLETFLLELSGKFVPEGREPHPLAIRAKELDLYITWSTGVSLTEEIASDSSTDTGIVALSYLLMLFYAALTLGGAAPLRSRFVYGSRGNAPPGQHVRTGFARGLRTVFAQVGNRAGPILLPNDEDELEEIHSRRQARQAIKGHLLYRFFVRSKVLLGLFGILIVLVAISSAVGIWSMLGVRSTLVIAEVIPFLVLAMGVDNVFLLSNEMDRQCTLASRGNPYYGASHTAQGLSWQTDYDNEEDDHLSLEDQGTADADLDLSGYAAVSPEAGASSAFHLSAQERAARALSRVGPSIVLSASIQISAFLLGALVPMPAVRNFTLYAAGSMIIAAVLHCTVFIAALSLDAQRTEGGRIDCLPCLRAFPQQRGEGISSLSISANTGLVRESRLAAFMREKYAPMIVHKKIKRFILAAFIAMGAVAIAFASKIEIGLDQRLALAPHSYLREYFDAVDTWLDVGPPVYFVEWRGDVKYKPVQRQMCSRFTTCAPFSVVNTLQAEQERPESSFLSEPVDSWIDDFFLWLNPSMPSSCQVRIDAPSTFCTPFDSPELCRPCFQGREYNMTLGGLPEDAEFMMFLRQWLRSPRGLETGENPLGGQGFYSSALSLKRSNLTVKDPLLDIKITQNQGVQPSQVAEWQGPEPSREDRKLNVYASHFRTSHVPLRSQTDFIDALQAAHRIAKETSRRSGVRLFPYSPFHVFYDQYLHLPKLTTQVLGLAACAIFGISFVLLGCWRTALVIVTCVASTLLGVAGTMGYVGIQFNALTLVNLSVCAAIAVEFCAHVAKAFMRAPGGLARNHPLAQKERDGRALAALGDVGASVLSGITGTKLIGTSVLWFSQYELLTSYYAKMWMALIVLGALHGLTLLPVLLSFYGGRGYASVEDESEVRRRLLRAQDNNEYRPFTDDEDDSGEEEED